jgi:hypothetical protein
MITEQQARVIAQSAVRLKKALHDAGFPAEANMMTTHAMPAIIRTVCAEPAAWPEAGGEDERHYQAYPGAGGDGPCAATQAYGATGCT